MFGLCPLNILVYFNFYDGKGKALLNASHPER